MLKRLFTVFYKRAASIDNSMQQIVPLTLDMELKYETISDISSIGAQTQGRWLFMQPWKRMCVSATASRWHGQKHKQTNILTAFYLVAAPDKPEILCGPVICILILLLRFILIHKNNVRKVPCALLFRRVRLSFAQIVFKNMKCRNRLSLVCDKN